MKFRLTFGTYRTKEGGKWVEYGPGAVIDAGDVDLQKRFSLIDVGKCLPKFSLVDDLVPSKPHFQRSSK
jgi:hypothetical protein